MTDIWDVQATSTAIQAAVNAAQLDDIVHLRDGTFDWGSGSVVNLRSRIPVIGAGKGSTILNKTVTGGTFFNMNGLTRPRVASMWLKGRATGDNGPVGVNITNSLDFLVDDCKITDASGNGVEVLATSASSACRGVVSKCDIRMDYKDQYSGIWGYGVEVWSYDYRTWTSDITRLMGQYETIPIHHPVVYVEDCTFYKTRHAIAQLQLGWYVFRHNTVYQDWNSGVDVHGGQASSGYGGRGGEVYNSEVDSPLGIVFRGGGGFIHHNICNCRDGDIGLQNEVSPDGRVDDLWIWENQMNGGGFYDDSSAVENVNYFRRAPSQAQDGFTYSAYPYPHPLRGVGPVKATLNVNSIPIQGVNYNVIKL